MSDRQRLNLSALRVASLGSKKTKQNKTELWSWRLFATRTCGIESKCSQSPHLCFLPFLVAGSGGSGCPVRPWSTMTLDLLEQKIREYDAFAAALPADHRDLLPTNVSYTVSEDDEDNYYLRIERSITKVENGITREVQDVEVLSGLEGHSLLHRAITAAKQYMKLRTEQRGTITIAVPYASGDLECSMNMVALAVRESVHPFQQVVNTRLVFKTWRDSQKAKQIWSNIGISPQWSAWAKLDLLSRSRSLVLLKAQRKRVLRGANMARIERRFIKWQFKRQAAHVTKFFARIHTLRKGFQWGLLLSDVDQMPRCVTCGKLQRNVAGIGPYCWPGCPGNVEPTIVIAEDAIPKVLGDKINEYLNFRDALPSNCRDLLSPSTSYSLCTGASGLHYLQIEKTVSVQANGITRVARDLNTIPGSDGVGFLNAVMDTCRKNMKVRLDRIASYMRQSDSEGPEDAEHILL